MPLKISQNSHENIKIPGQSVGGPGKRRSSHWRCSVKKGVLKNLANFEGKKPVLESLFNKIAAN